MALNYDGVIEKYEPTLGLEVHVELNTNTKMFCGCATAFGAEPNTQTCPVCLGIPGALPYTNRQAVNHVIKFGLAFGCRINLFSKFIYSYLAMPMGFEPTFFSVTGR